MKIITNDGNLNVEDLDQFEISIETREFIDSQTEALAMFFSEEIDLTQMDLEDLGIDEKIIEELENCANALNKFENIERALAISEFLSTPLADIEESSYDENLFVCGNEEYLVLTDSEADDRALQSVKDLIDDIGITGFGEPAKSYAFDNFVQTEWFDEAMHEYNESYAYDIKSESASEPYLNRLHEEMVEKGILEEPEWPDEDDFESEEFDEEEPIEDDFDSEEEFEEAHNEWESAKEEFEEENSNSTKYEDARAAYESELESDIDNAMESFIEALDNDYDDGLDYYEQNFGKEEIAAAATNNNLFDEDAFAEWLVNENGRGTELNSYNGGEDSITITYSGEDLEFFIYRRN